MKKNIVTLISFQSILIMLLFFTGCKKDGNLGLDILPAGDEVIFKYDTIAVSAYTFGADSTITLSGSPLIGSLNDPIFGKSSASFLIKLNNTITEFVPEDIIEVDSMILRIPFTFIRTVTDSETDETTSFSVVDSSYYGDLNTPFNFRVYELAKEILTDTVYYSNMELDGWYNSTELMASEITYRGTEKYLEFKMPSKFYNRFKNAALADFETDDAFSEFFKGFYFSCEEQMSLGGAIFSLSTTSVDAGVSIYYRSNNEESRIDTLSTVFNFGYTAPNINIFTHDYTGTAFENTIGSTLNQDTVTYIQSMDGLKTRILIEDSELAKFSNKVLYDARLLIRLHDTLHSEISPYEPVIAPVIEKTSLDELSTEYLSEYYMNGALGVFRFNDLYTFNITKYMQDLLDDTSQNKGLYIKVNLPHRSAKRTILRSGNNSKPMEIIIKYSDLPTP